MRQAHDYANPPQIRTLAVSSAGWALEQGLICSPVLDTVAHRRRASPAPRAQRPSAATQRRRSRYLPRSTSGSLAGQPACHGHLAIWPSCNTHRANPSCCENGTPAAKFSATRSRAAGAQLTRRGGRRAGHDLVRLVQLDALPRGPIMRNPISEAAATSAAGVSIHNVYPASTAPTVMPATGFLRQPQVLGLVPISKSTLWRRVQDRSFPEPIKLSARITAWRAEDIRRWIDEQGAGR